MKIGDIVKSRHTGQEYRVVEMNKKHKCAYVCVPINPEKYTFFDFLIRFAIELLLFSKNIIFIRKKSQK